VKKTPDEIEAEIAAKEAEKEAKGKGKKEEKKEKKGKDKKGKKGGDDEESPGWKMKESTFHTDALQELADYDEKWRNRNES
jgi:hypothetical protein